VTQAQHATPPELPADAEALRALVLAIHDLVDLREILNAIRDMARSGGGWRMLPTD
jgi:transposase